MDVHIELAAEELFKIGPISVTNSMLMMFIVMGFLLLVGNLVSRRAQLIPGRLQGLVELLLEFLLGMTESSGGKSFGRRVFPLVSALFIFILFANYTGLLPGVGVIGVEREEEEESGEARTNELAAVYTVASVSGPAADSFSTAAQEEASDDEKDETVLVPFLRPPTADLNMTLAMALVAFTAIQVFGIRANGVIGRLKHLASPPVLFPIEVVSELSRIISLSARLFGNVFAGEALLGVMYAITAKTYIAIVTLFVPVVFLFLEILFGTVQALVFAMLTLVYIALASAHDGHEAEGHAAHGHEPVTTRTTGD
jgi:F-type H+-transporting ATPase subunit a